MVREAIISTGMYEDIGEIFHSDFVDELSVNRTSYNFFAFLREKVAADIHNLHPQYWEWIFDEFIDHCFNDHSVVLTDIKYNSINYVHSSQSMPNFVENYHVINTLARRGVTFFHVIRNNILNSIVSEALAKKTGQWSLRPEEKRVSAQIRLDPPRLLYKLNAELEARNNVELALSRLRSVQTFYYSEMFDSGGDFSCEFVNKIEVDIGWWLRKQDSEPGSPVKQGVAGRCDKLRGGPNGARGDKSRMDAER